MAAAKVPLSAPVNVIVAVSLGVAFPSLTVTFENGLMTLPGATIWPATVPTMFGATGERGGPLISKLVLVSLVVSFDAKFVMSSSNDGVTVCPAATPAIVWKDRPFNSVSSEYEEVAERL